MTSTVNMYAPRPRRSPSPEIVVVQPPPNPYTTEKMKAESELFKRLLGRRLVFTDECEPGWTVESIVGTSFAPALPCDAISHLPLPSHPSRLLFWSRDSYFSPYPHHAWKGVTWEKRHRWMAALHPGDQPARKRNGLEGEDLADAIIDEWASIRTGLKLPIGVQALPRSAITITPEAPSLVGPNQRRVSKVAALAADASA
ncbi:hypothetical protein BKA62DRAFT_711356 [Auriculariales sp. MPI-PUGE-AT-0066]|nr:hypothetical protein BKA62DRAFT_711356 [Auriculariales sp. MPI-PUGE-AT-0066]